MRRLHWHKISPAPSTPGGPAAHDVVWQRFKSEVQPGWDEGGELSAVLEAKFTDVPKKRGSKKGGGAEEGDGGGAKDGRKNKVKSVLEMKRSNALGILLSKMPEIDAIVAAIWSLDDR